MKIRPCDLLMICEECEADICVPDDFASGIACCRSCGVAVFFDVSDLHRQALTA